jgi:hypothetical protein
MEGRKKLYFVIVWLCGGEAQEGMDDVKTRPARLSWRSKAKEQEICKGGHHIRTHKMHNNIIISSVVEV